MILFSGRSSGRRVPLLLAWNERDPRIIIIDISCSFLQFFCFTEEVLNGAADLAVADLRKTSFILSLTD